MAQEGDRRAARKRAYALFAVYCLAALAAVTWPVFPMLGNRVEPLVLGLPFSLAWLVGWIVSTLVALIVLERVAHRE